MNILKDETVNETENISFKTLTSKPYILMGGAICLTLGALLIAGFMKMGPATHDTHHEGASIENMYGPYVVETVVDGDTIVVKQNGSSVVLELTGIKAPEVETNEGLNTKTMVEEHLTGKTIYLEYDNLKVGATGNDTAYVFVVAHEDEVTDREDLVLLQEQLLSEGLVRHSADPSNNKYEELLFNTEQLAVINQAGYWETGFFQQ